MTRRGTKTTTHVHRAHAPTNGGDKHELMLHRHRLLRRTASFVLARKYRFNYPSSRFDPWPTESELREMSSARYAAAGGGNSKGGAEAAGGQLASAFSGPKGYSRDELLNFWRDLSLVAKRRLLRIRREVYLTALDEFLVQQNLCCECHDNVIAEWEDHERKRSGSRSLQDVFSVFPPFLDDEDDEDVDDEDEDDEDEDDDEDDEDAFSGDMNDESDEEDEVLDADEAILDDDEVVFKYELEHGIRRGPLVPGLGSSLGPLGPSLVGGGAAAGSRTSMLTDEYLAALEVGKRQEDELLRLIQKEERYIIIREDHSDFIMDLIRCGEQFSYLSPFRPGFDGDESEDEDEDDGAECPGANTSHLAQEYLLEVLAIKFREQLEDAYQEALQHSLAIQAELLRDELADLQASQKQSATSAKKKKNKEKKKRKKKEASAVVAMPAARSKQAAEAKKSPEVNAVRQPSPDAKSRLNNKLLAPTDPFKDVGGAYRSGVDLDAEAGGPADDELDREVEQFRLLLEKINAESSVRAKKKIVLPPAAFARLSSMAVS